MDHQDVEWLLTPVIQRYQLRLVEQICNSILFYFEGKKDQGFPLGGTNNRSSATSFCNWGRL